MQQFMEAAEHQHAEDEYEKMYANHEAMAEALSDIIPTISDTHPDLYIKYMNILALANEITKGD